MVGLAISSSIITSLKINKKLYLYVARGNGGLISLWAFGLCFLVYVSIFRALEMDSPNAALRFLNSTKFWFLISNTLIFIIAADSGALSSSSSSSSSSTFNAAFVGEKPIVVPQDEEEDQLQILIPRPTETNGPLLENVEDEIIAEKLNEESLIIPPQQQEEEKTEEEGEGEEEEETEEGGETVEEEKQEEEDEEEEEEEEEDDGLSRLSNEELNRRVEDFIQNFNRQIRLQAATPELRRHSFCY